MRDHKWLKTRLETIWQRFYPDVQVANNIFVKFGQKSRTRLGSIKPGRADKTNTIITINGYFVDEFIPEYVVDAVLAHELTHYAQGFFHPEGPKVRYPHKGGIVNREMCDRGLKNLLQSEKRWIKANWHDYVKKNHKRLF